MRLLCLWKYRLATSADFVFVPAAPTDTDVLSLHYDEYAEWQIANSVRTELVFAAGGMHVVG